MRCWLIALLLTLGFASCQWPDQMSPPAKPIIFDSDFGPDYDDVGALALLHALADKKEAHILATISSNRHELSAPALDVINTYFGRPDIRIAVPKKGGILMGAIQKWPELITGKYPHSTRSNSEAEDAVQLYRRLLANAPDKGISIVTVGFLTNLKNLLDSGADSFSPLSGTELVSQKVQQLVCMAGAFPKGREFNVYTDSLASLLVFQNWPTPILFSGFEIGEKILTGYELTAKGDPASPVRDVYHRCLKMERSRGRMSWDQTAVLVAVRGPEAYYHTRTGRIIINPDGSNDWEAAPGPHQYLVEKKTSRRNEVHDRAIDDASTQ